MKKQHAPLRVPSSWEGQARALVIQIERILDDIYSLLIRLGETEGTAFPGDLGKIAYDHATDENRVTTAKTEGLYKVGVTAEGHVSSATAAGRADIIGTGILHNGPDYTTAGHYALDAATGYTLSTSTNAIRSGLLKVAVKSGSDWKLPSGTDAAVGDYLSVNGTLGVATAAITGGITVLTKNTNWETVAGGILNRMQANKAEKSTTVSDVAYDSGNQKITKTINGTTTDVVAVSTIKSALGVFTWGQLAGQ